jgi:hypothetical protein
MGAHLSLEIIYYVALYVTVMKGRKDAWHSVVAEAIMAIRKVGMQLMTMFVKFLLNFNCVLNKVSVLT